MITPEVLITVLDGNDKELTEIVYRKVNAAAKMVRDNVVIPYCDKYGYRFVSDYQAWVFLDRDDSLFEIGRTRHKRRGRPDESHPDYDDDRWFTPPTDEDHKICKLLEYCFEMGPGQLGAFIENYTP